MVTHQLKHESSLVVIPSESLHLRFVASKEILDMYRTVKNPNERYLTGTVIGGAKVEQPVKSHPQKNRDTFVEDIAGYFCWLSREYVEPRVVGKWEHPANQTKKMGIFYFAH